MKNNNKNNFSQKKYNLYCIFVICSVCILPNLVIPFKKNDAICIIIILTSLILAITFFILLIKEARKRLKQNFMPSWRINQLITKFLKKINNFKYETASKEEKLHYMIYSLYNASEAYDLSIFYKDCKNYTKEELINLTSKLDITDDLKQFINEIVINKKMTKSVFRFQSELDGLLLIFSKVEIIQNPLLFDKNVLYDSTKHLRYRVVKRGKYYKIEKCCFDPVDNIWIGDYETMSTFDTYTDYDTAYQNMQNLFAIDVNFIYELIDMTCDEFFLVTNYEEPKNEQY